MMLLGELLLCLCVGGSLPVQELARLMPRRNHAGISSQPVWFTPSLHGFSRSSWSCSSGEGHGDVAGILAVFSDLFTLGIVVDSRQQLDASVFVYHTPYSTSGQNPTLLPSLPAALMIHQTSAAAGGDLPLESGIFAEPREIVARLWMHPRSGCKVLSLR